MYVLYRNKRQDHVASDKIVASLLSIVYTKTRLLSHCTTEKREVFFFFFFFFFFFDKICAIVVSILHVFW